MKIGEVARNAGLETSAIRYYEKVGILAKPARESGRRSYPPEVLDLLFLVQFARGVGLSIREVKILFGQGVDSGMISARWATLAKAKIQSLDQQMIRLRAAQKLLSTVLKCGCIDPGECGRQIRAQARLLYPETAAPTRASTKRARRTMGTK